MNWSLQNNFCSLTVDSFGGAITDFHLNDDAGINPLSFAFTKEQMPVNNRDGAPYQGHFVCLGRWGVPSGGEIKAGIPNHGEAANIHWKTAVKNKHALFMQTQASLEGLHIERNVQLDEQNAVFMVDETVTNTRKLGRLYTITQHPTLAAPFLNASTIINCNASIGFDQSQYLSAQENNYHFPKVKDDRGNSLDLKNPQVNYNSVFSFITDRGSDIGWVTAYSPIHNVLLGYVWKRSDYPWIHLWQHWIEQEIAYRGIEFGTAGIHQPYKEILNTATALFGVKTLDYIDAGESVSKKYFSFMYKPEGVVHEVEDVKLMNNSIIIQSAGEASILHTSFNIINELSN